MEPMHKLEGTAGMQLDAADVRTIQLRIVRDFFNRRALMHALGIDGKKLPTDGRPVRWWYGLQIYLRPQEQRPIKRQYHTCRNSACTHPDCGIVIEYGIRKHPMRLRVICTCGVDICFGRLAQHLRYTHKAGA